MATPSPTRQNSVGDRCRRWTSAMRWGLRRMLCAVRQAWLYIQRVAQSVRRFVKSLPRTTVVAGIVVAVIGGLILGFLQDGVAWLVSTPSDPSERHGGDPCEILSQVEELANDGDWAGVDTWLRKWDRDDAGMDSLCGGQLTVYASLWGLYNGHASLALRRLNDLEHHPHYDALVGHVHYARALADLVAGRWTAARDVLVSLADAEVAPMRSDKLHFNVLYDLVRVKVLLCDDHRMDEYWQRIQDLAKGRAEREARLYILRGLECYWRGSYSQAREQFIRADDESLSAMRRGLKLWYLSCLENLGGIGPEEAEDLRRRALDQFKDIGDVYHQLEMQLQAANQAAHDGELAASQAASDEAHTSLGKAHAALRKALAEVEHLLKNAQESDEFAYRQGSWTSGTPGVYGDGFEGVRLKARLYRLRADHLKVQLRGEGAEPNPEVVSEIMLLSDQADSLGDPWLQVQSRRFLARLCFDAGEYPEWEAHLGLAVQAARTAGYVQGEIDALYDQTEGFLEIGQQGQSADNSRRILELRRKLGG